MLRKIFGKGLYCSLILMIAAFAAVAQTTEFTYQGRLADNNGMALTGSYDFQFGLYDASGNLLGTQTRLSVSVSNGVFATTLDYGTSPQQFDGTARLLQISVRPAGNGMYTDLLPRQPINSAPYSTRSREAATADAATNATQLGGIPAAQFVQTDAGGNVSIGGNLTVGGTLTQPIVNAQNEYQIGGQRILSSPIGTDNLFIGRSAGLNNTSSGIANTFVGSSAGRGNTDGIFNTFLGSSAGFSNTTGGENTFLGSNAGRFNTTGNDNTFVGLSAGSNNSTGQRNSYFGKNAGANCPTNNCPTPSTGNDNSFFGFESGFGNSTGVNNSFFGESAGRTNTIGQGNSFFGAEAGRANLDGNTNSFFGFQAGFANTGGNSNAFFGYSAGFNNLTGSSNALFGTLAGFTNTTGFRNSYFGIVAGRNNSTGGNNSFFGYAAGINTTGSDNVFVGSDSGFTNVSGQNNILIGSNSDVGSNNLNFASAFGAGAVVNSSNTIVLGRNLDAVEIPGNLVVAGVLTANLPSGDASYVQNRTTAQTGIANFNISGTGTAGILNAVTQFSIGGASVLRSTSTTLSVGRDAGTSGAQNTFLGNSAGNAITTGQQNVFVGSAAGSSTNDGFNNVFVGRSAGATNIDGNQNVNVGAFSGANTTGSSNVFVGFGAGSVNAGGSNNTAIGNNAEVATGELSFATAVGSNAVVSNSNSVVLGRTADTVRIPGDLQLSGLATSGTNALCRNPLTSFVTLCNSSSLRYKTNIAGFTGGLDLVKRLKPITFDWKDGGMHDLGFGAEDVAAIEPLLVMYDKDNRIEGVKYDRIGVVLINAVNEQQAQITTQQKEIAEQNNVISKQQAEINLLKSHICLQSPAAAFCGPRNQ